MKINQTVLMSDALNFSSKQAINPYYFDSHTDKVVAQAEHDAIRNALEAAGVKVISTPSPADSQDGVYTANWGLVRGNKVVLARLPNVRRTEETFAKNKLTSLGKEVVEVPAGLRFSGQGDALACGNYLFCGQGYRSNQEAQAFAAETLGYERIQLQTIPYLDSTGEPVINAVSGWEDSFFYDIDLALAVIKHPATDQKGLVAFCPEAFTAESVALITSLPDIETVTISLEEAEKGFAANLVSTGDTVIMGDNAPNLAKKLNDHGIKTVTPHIRELSKGGGYIRCTTLTLD